MTAEPQFKINEYQNEWNKSQTQLSLPIKIWKNMTDDPYVVTKMANDRKER